MTVARCLAGDALAAALRDSRAITWSRVDDLHDAQWRVPQRPGLNPIAWELAHLAWFGEFWILRGPHRASDDGFVHAAHPPCIAGPDGLFDSARLAHERRWHVPLPSRATLRERLDAQLGACIAALPAGADDAALYFHRLALFHEDMHAEAFAWLRATLGFAAPRGLELRRVGPRAVVHMEGGDVCLGASAGGFAFDNEQPAQHVEVAPFAIDVAPVRAGDFLRFVEAGGYDAPAHWPGEAGAWRARCGRDLPERWRRRGSHWEARWFDRWQPLDPDQPAIHVNAWEAEAYCRWAGRRLPTAAQWEHAARASAMDWGHGVWEWTCDPFLPRPGFAPGPYRDYSAPWFGDHRELRGGSFATHARMHDARYRNFFLPDRCDVFAGFRTVATVS